MWQAQHVTPMAMFAHASLSATSSGARLASGLPHIIPVVRGHVLNTHGNDGHLWEPWCPVQRCDSVGTTNESKKRRWQGCVVPLVTHHPSDKVRSMHVSQVVRHCWIAGVVQAYAHQLVQANMQASPVAMTGYLVQYSHSLWCTKCYTMGGSQTYVLPTIATSGQQVRLCKEIHKWLMVGMDNELPTMQIWLPMT